MKKIYLVLLFSLVIRLVAINQSMWLDEAISANVSKRPMLDIINSFSFGDFHPPSYYLFLNFWTSIFGNGVIMMRFSSVLFSLITIWLVYEIGKEIKDEKIGFWAALLTAVNPLFIYFSQELRMYMMMVMLLMGALYFFIRLNKKVNWKNVLGFNLLAALSFLTFYGSVFLIAAMLLYWLINKKFKLLFINSSGLILAILVISPLLWKQLMNSRKALIEVSNWSLTLGNVNFKNLALIPIKFTVGKISWYPKIFYYGIATLSTLIVWLLAFKEMIKDKLLRFLLIVPLIMGIIFSLKSPLLQYFRFLYLIPILSLLLAKSKKGRKIVLIIFLLFTSIYLINSNMHREDWKSLSGTLKKEDNVYLISSFGDPIRFYNPEIKINDIKYDEAKEEKIKVVKYGEEIHGINSQEKVEKLGYKKIGEENFRGIKIEEWEK